ncbi:MAG: hypothetical protein Alis3KO_31650 [Aliiglaciecola sp.]
MQKSPVLKALLASLFAAIIPGVYAQPSPNNWEVSPKVCIVESMGDECEIALNINVQKLEKGQYCYFQNDTLLSCWHTENTQNQVVLRFSEPTILILKNQHDETVFSHPIDLKARESTKRTRRVRQPWSLF